MSDGPPDNTVTRRGFLRGAVRGAAVVSLGGVAAWAVARGRGRDLVWQIDPDRCTACGNCATYCVRGPSAVRCVHAYAMCGYCKRCFGYFEPQADRFTTGGENQLCPTGAIQRKFVEEPYYEYDIVKDLCIGCGKCVKGCNAFGNGSLYLQVDQGLCVQCNECAIAAACPAGAFVRMPFNQVHEWLKAKGRRA
ncbi:MAG TPA: 4Fe-4S binding protein [Phycisphaerae bacterium]|nr:4Fe-4S binding protein [Phycisphaerae bacterium]